MTIDITLIVVLVFTGIWTVMTARLLRSVIGLAITSVLVTIIMFRLDSPLAAVFELSVCAGLISAIFISCIGLTQRLTEEQAATRRRQRLTKFWFLPVLVLLIGIVLTQLQIPFDFIKQKAPSENDVRIIMWNLRHLDLVGQIIILLAGAFGVVSLFKD